MKRSALTGVIFAGLFTASAQSAILSMDSSYGVDTITRDTATGLDWLDVTVTRGLSYDQVTAQLGVGGTYEGYRYATVAELDQLIINFGYAKVNATCGYTAIHCDVGILTDSIIVENMIQTLGDTLDGYMDQTSNIHDIGPDAAGFTYGLLGTSHKTATHPIQYDLAYISDNERINRADGTFALDAGDIVSTVFNSWYSVNTSLYVGSFLVAPSPVPVPGAVWLFSTALIGLVGIKRRK